jgi:hypothetical protein
LKGRPQPHLRRPMITCRARADGHSSGGTERRLCLTQVMSGVVRLRWRRFPNACRSPARSSTPARLPFPRVIQVAT